MDPGKEQEFRSTVDYESGLPDHHDPTAGVGGAPPAYSALTFRLVLAGFGALLGLAGVIVGLLLPHLLLLTGGALLALVAGVNLTVVAVRKRRGEPG